MKRFKVRVCCALVALVALGAAVPSAWAGANYSNVILGDGPIGYWRLGESATTGTASDSSGLPTGRGGVYSRAVTSGVPGAINGDPDTAASFDGLSSFVEVYGGPTNPYNLANSFTLEAWVINNGPLEPNVARILSTRILSGTGSPSTTGGFGFGVLRSGAMRFTTFGIKDYDSSLTTLPVDGAWHHVVLVLDSNNTANFYLDGQLTDAITASKATASSPSNLNIGRNPIPDGSGLSEYFNGSIDEVAIYNVELTADQVLAHYQAAK
jgi:hypothetical protein